jgi:type VI secretion system protein ImpE
MEIEPPAQLRDLVWATVQVETADKEMKAMMPARYVDSGAHDNDLVRLGRMTDWRELGPELYAGAGLRLFAVDGEERPALGVRGVVFDAAGGVAEAPAS